MPIDLASEPWELPEAVLAVLGAICRTRAPYARQARLGEPEALRALEADGWIVPWREPSGKLADRWTLSPWAAVYLGVELAEPMAAGRDPRWYRAEGTERACAMGVSRKPTCVRLPARPWEIRFTDLTDDEREELDALAFRDEAKMSDDGLYRDGSGEVLRLFGGVAVKADRRLFKRTAPQSKGKSRRKAKAR